MKIPAPMDNALTSKKGNRQDGSDHTPPPTEQAECPPPGRDAIGGALRRERFGGQWTGGRIATRRRLDLFGGLVLSLAAANAGGIACDLLIGAVPPAAISAVSRRCAVRRRDDVLVGSADPAAAESGAQVRHCPKYESTQLACIGQDGIVQSCKTLWRRCRKPRRPHESRRSRNELLGLDATREILGERGFASLASVHKRGLSRTVRAGSAHGVVIRDGRTIDSVAMQGGAFPSGLPLTGVPS